MEIFWELIRSIRESYVEENSKKFEQKNTIGRTICCYLLELVDYFLSAKLVF